METKSWSPQITSIPIDLDQPQMKAFSLVALLAFAAVAIASNLSEDFPQPPFNFVHSFPGNQNVTLTCPADCGNPNTPSCVWNPDIQDTCSTSFGKRSASVVREKKQEQGGCWAFRACGPVCFSDGEGGYVCGCVSCG
ncbi:hypothetical protein PROFUN_10196 [Planoprotostelium fungivorum]|uniref:Uncharacterized protein n=1 Tax=Planoprotostelium fungivorum TaxID=1890364 RepID=A0A2P6MQ70_9EUKA|nr:hypothetical protein PROFUN_10196 [Planoprotostelium fungivorum]